MSSEKSKFYRDNENLSKSLNSSNNKYKKYNTKSEMFPYYSKNKANPNMYIKLDPEYLENNYKKEENFQNNNNNYNNKNYRINPNNTKNNYYVNNNNFRKSPLKSRKLKDAQSPFENNDNNIYYGSNTYDINNREKLYPDKFDDYLYLNLNKSIEYDNRKNYDYITLTEPNISSPKLMIYQKKMITIFAQIINKIIEKNKKKYMMTKFFNALKNKSDKPKYDENNYLYKRRHTKHNAYENIMFVSALGKDNSPKGERYNISNNNYKLINNKRKDKNDETNQIYNNTLKQNNRGNNRSNMERLKELQKKYDKIYEKKKNNKKSSVDDKYKRYILRKNKTHDVFNITFEKPLNEEKPFKKKILKNRLNMDRAVPPSSISLSHDFIPSLYKEKYIKFPEKKGENNKIKKLNTPRKVRNKIIIIKKVKMTPKVVANEPKIEIFKVYNIKDIVTPDKRLYVYINYITLSNKKKDKSNTYKYYDNYLLKISDKIRINYISNNNNKIYKPKMKIIKYQIHLTKIQEDPLYTIVEDDIGQYDYLEKAISILERYKNKLKNKIIKNSILNYGKDNYEEEEE